MSNIKKIIYSGGGTGGSVMPLLAINDELINSDFEVEALFIGTSYGPERDMVEQNKIRFMAIFSGKFRRYFSVQNFVDPLKIVVGFFQALTIIIKYKPDIMLSAGGYVAVPVAYACFVMRVPVLIHQQDVRPGLANKLMMPIAKIITTTFKKSNNDYGLKAIWTGNPVRKLNVIKHRLRFNEIKRQFGFVSEMPIVMIIGGGTGARAINEFVEVCLTELLENYNIIHVVGNEKRHNLNNVKNVNYYLKDFLNREEIEKAYALTEVVVSRAGMGVLSELATLGMPSIVIPMPNSHQEENAQALKDSEASAVLSEEELRTTSLVSYINELYEDNTRRNKLGANIKKVINVSGAEKITEIIKKRVLI